MSATGTTMGLDYVLSTTWRSVLSNRLGPLEFWERQWKELGDAAYQKKKHPGFCFLEEEPRVWDKVVRSIVAHLSRTGMVGPGYCPYPIGQTMAVPAYPGDPRRDLVINYCHIRDDWPTMSSSMRDPLAVDLLATAREFAAKHSNARFALIRIWSTPHFYLLMLGLEKRDWMSFSDVIGRAWSFCFIPKDMPYSEWSMQHNLDIRLERVKKTMLAPDFETKRDIVLVMSERENKLSSILASIVFIKPMAI